MRHAKTRKLFPLYEGLFRVESEIHPNAYKITRVTGEMLGTYNTRQLKPHHVPMWKPTEPPEVTEAAESQLPQLSRLTETQVSDPAESQYLPDSNISGNESPEPGPSRRKRKTRARLSALARRLSGSSSETAEFWCQPMRMHKVENQTESPPNSDDT